MRSAASKEPPLLPLAIREEKTRRRGGSEKGYYNCSPYACRAMHHARHSMLRVGAGM
jgi:hypothetical protein